MRYKIITTDCEETRDFESLTIAGFHDKELAIAVCKTLAIRCYVRDCFEMTTIYQNY